MNIYKSLFIKSTISFILLVTILFSTSPSNMPLLAMLIVPVLVSLFFYSVLVAASLYFIESINLHKAKIIGLFGLLLPGFTLMLGALHQLSFIDVVLAILFSGGIVFYIFRQNSHLEDASNIY